ncbi:methylamine utilization protein MauJ [Sphingobium sp.]|uniref:methylamine utilization protein MauJ n=1 Tax=Sphingobium sp. TaxID=1912891 RepID=UPI00261F8C64|nr:methylamine utilization protein MauJ [Sphingobium sp.]
MGKADDNQRFLGQTAGSNLTISLDQLGAPGVHGCIEIVPLFTNEAGDEPAPKPQVEGVHTFAVSARMAKSPTALTLQGDFGEGDGTSYLTVSNEVARIEVGGFGGLLHFHRNAAGELATVSASIDAENANEAHATFLTQLNSFIDRVSYLAAVPMFIELIVVKDTATDAQFMFFVSPPRSSQINPGGETLHTELAPVYALYREAQNSFSPYYRVLCLFKIMEGLLLSLRTQMRARARQSKIEIYGLKLVVPDHQDLLKPLKQYVGKPIKDFFDNFLQKEYRDAMAHFNLKGRQPLNVSDPQHWRRFSDVAFICDLCVRLLIAQHEQLLTSFGQRLVEESR